MKLNIGRKLSQISLLAVTALGLTLGGHARAATKSSEIDSNLVGLESLYAPSALDKTLLQDQLDSEYAPLDGGYDPNDPNGDRWGRGNRWGRGRGRRQVVACYARNWQGDTYVGYREDLNARRAQWDVVQYCEQMSFFQCQALGCRREWGN